MKYRVLSLLVVLVACQFPAQGAVSIQQLSQVNENSTSQQKKFLGKLQESVKVGGAERHVDELCRMYKESPGVLKKLADKHPADFKNYVVEEDRSGLSMVHYAASRGKVEFISVVGETINNDCVDVFAHFASGNRGLLHFAVQNGHEEIISNVLAWFPARSHKLKKMLECVDVKGNTPLDEALNSARDRVTCRLAEASKMLFENSVTVDQYGKKCWHTAPAIVQAYRKQGIPTTWEVLLKNLNDEEQTLMHRVARAGMFDTAALLLPEFRKLSDIDLQPGATLLPSQSYLWSPDKHGMTAMHYAVEAGSLRVFESLVAELDMTRNEDFDLLTKTNNNGQTVLHIAVSSGHEDLVKTIADKLGAKFYDNASLQDNYEKTVLHVAAQEACLQNSLFSYIATRLGGNLHSLAEIKDIEGKCLYDYASTNLRLGRELMCLVGHPDFESVITALQGILGDDVVDCVRLPDSRMRTVLHHAVATGNCAAVSDILRLIPFHCQDEVVRKGDNKGNTVLHDAVKAGADEIMQQLVGLYGPPTQKNALFDVVHKKNTAGETVLHIAAKIGNAQAVEILSRALGTDLFAAAVRHKDRMGSTPVETALLHGKKSVVVSIEKALGPNEFKSIVLKEGDQQGKTALHDAALMGNNDLFEVSDEIIAVLPDLACKKDAYGLNAAHCAADGGHVQFLATLCERLEGVAPGIAEEILQARDDNDDTVLHYAGYNGHDDVIDYVRNKVSAKAFSEMMKQVNKDGNTFVHVAAEQGRVAVLEKVKGAVSAEEFKQLVRQTDREGRTLLHLAALAQSAPVVRLISESLSEKELEELALAPDRNDTTVLHEAAAAGQVDIMNEMAKKFSDENRRQDFFYKLASATEQVRGSTPVHVAFAKGGINFARRVKRLIGGANFVTLLGARDNKRQTAIYLASRFGQENLVAYAASQHNVDLAQHVRMRSISGQTALHRVASAGHAGVLALFGTKVPKRAFNEAVRIGDKLKRTPFHYAAIKGQEEVIGVLKKKCGENFYSQVVKQRTNEGFTGLHLASQEGHDGFIDALGKMLTPAQFNELAMMSNVRKETALHVAAFKGHAAVIRSLAKYLRGHLYQALKRGEGRGSPLNLAAQEGHEEATKALLELTKVATPNLYFVELVQTCREAFRGGNSTYLVNKLCGMIHQELNMMKSHTNVPKVGCKDCEKLESLAKLLEENKKLVPVFMQASVPAQGLWLFDALKLGHGEKMKGLLKIEGFDTREYLLKENEILATRTIERNAKVGKTLLHVAAAQGHKELILFLIKQVSNVAERRKYVIQPDEKERTALHAAVLHGQKVSVETFAAQKKVSYGVLANRQDDVGMSPLHLAAENKQPLMLRALLKGLGDDKTRSLLKKHTKDGRNVLHVAAQSRAVDCIKYLAGLGLNDVFRDLCGATDSEERTALHLAASYADRDTVVALLSSLDSSSKQAQLLESGRAGKTVVHEMAQKGKKESLEYILTIPQISVKKLLNVTDEHGNRPLHLAAQYGHAKTLKVLLEKMRSNNLIGALIKRRNEDGRTAKRLAERAGHNACKKLLKEYAE